MKYHAPRSTAWLWKLSFLIFLAGGALAWLIYRYDASLQQEAHLRMTIYITVIVGGTCMICATANWWLKR